MAEADRRAIAAGTPESVLIGRAAARGRDARGADARRNLRAASRRRRGQGQQRCRRPGRGRPVCGGAASGSTCSRSPTSSTATSSCARSKRADLFVDAMFGTGFRGALDGSGRMGRHNGAGAGARGRSRSTSLRASTARPARSRGRGRGRRDDHVRRAQARPAVRTRARPRRARALSPTSASSSAPSSLFVPDVGDLRLPRARRERAQVVVGLDGVRWLERPDRRAVDGRTGRRTRAARGWSCAACPDTKPRPRRPAPRS